MGVLNTSQHVREAAELRWLSPSSLAGFGPVLHLRGPALHHASKSLVSRIFVVRFHRRPSPRISSFSLFFISVHLPSPCKNIAAMAPAGTEHYDHHRANRKIIDPSSLLQRRRNLKAAIELLQLLFLGPPPHVPEIPEEEQEQSIVLKFGSNAAIGSYTSQEVATELVREFEGILGAISEEDAASEEWLEANTSMGYASYRKIEGCSLKGRAYDK